MPRYHSQAYWDERYTREPGLYDWYQTYTRLSPLISKYVQPRQRVLQIGSGSSPLGQEMVQMGGFHHVHNIDYSQIVIDSMRNLHQAVKGLTYATGDARSMPEIHQQYDCVLDKGTLDATLSGEDGTTSGQNLILECYRVLKPGGCLLIVSHASPETRLLVIGQRWRQIEVYCLTKPSLQGTSAIDSAHTEAAEIRGPFLSTDTDMMVSLDNLEGVHFAYVCKR